MEESRCGAQWASGDRVPPANGAIYFSRIKASDPLRENRTETFAPSGGVAGVIARTDAARGIWKAPAGLQATLVGVDMLGYTLNDVQNGRLNARGVNCLRRFPNVGPVVWGARTLLGDDERGSEWKYLPVRRTALYISILRKAWSVGPSGWFPSLTMSRCGHRSGSMSVIS